jgi:hypothetical protein
MKKVLLSLALAMSVGTFAQSTNVQEVSDSVYIINEVDEMSGKKYSSVNLNLVVYNESKTKGFKITPYVKENNVKMLVIKAVNFSGCNENDELIFLFENGERLVMKSWNKFNCEGKAYYNLDKDQINLLNSNKITKIRFTSGKSYDNVTGEPSMADYFIKLFAHIEELSI